MMKRVLMIIGSVLAIAIMLVVPVYATMDSSLVTEAETVLIVEADADLSYYMGNESTYQAMRIGQLVHYLVEGNGWLIVVVAVLGALCVRIARQARRVEQK